jgi:glycosyltransferase involved in cell wall biosynthesis
LRIAVYYPWIYLTSGAERTLLEFARRSRHNVVLFTSRYDAEATYPELKELDVRVLDSVSVRRSPLRVAISGLRIVLRKLDLQGFDALVVLCEGLGDLIVLRNFRTPTFNLCLTPLRIVFDPVYRATYLAEKSFVERLLIRSLSVVFRGIDRLVWSRYRRIFPISAEVQRRIERGGLALGSKLRVLHPGVDLDAFKPSGTSERVFFVPGRIMWTKNLELAIEAFRLFRERTSEPESWRLRIAGIVDRKSEPYLEKLRSLAAGDPAVEFRIRPSDEEMRSFYSSCFGTLFTAYNEDWGLVVIEAMASGKPCIALARGGPCEIVQHEENGLLASPTPEAFAEAMLRLTTDPALRERIVATAPRSAARFGWQRFVDELDQELEASLRGGREHQSDLHGPRAA